jgi:hypothetical protein
MDAPALPPVMVIAERLTENERRALALLRQLRLDKKPAILWVDESGAVRIYRAERAGVLSPA